MGEKTTHIITRDRYDAVLLDLDGVITDTASLHAACWKQMFDEYLGTRDTKRRTFRPFDLARIIGCTWTESPASTVFAIFSHHAISNSLREALTTPHRPKRWAGSGTAKTTWSTRSSKTRGRALRGKRQAHPQLRGEGSKLRSSPRARIARPS